MFVDYDFDLALSYKNNADRFGTTNTGVMLFRASKDSLYFLKRVIDATAVITNPKGKSTGGENQLAIDEVVKKRIPQGRQKTIKLENNRSVLLHALSYPSPLNYNAAGCCDLPGDTLVAHLKAFKKQFAFQACCRKFAGNKSQAAWLHSCDCAQVTDKQVKCPVKCTPQDPQDAAAVKWCESVLQKGVHKK